MKTVYTSDNLQNFVTNLGTEADKASYSFFVRMLLSRPLLDAVYCSGGIGGKIIDCVAEDCGRKWRRVTIPDEDPSPFLDLERELGVNSAIVEVIRWSRLYGGAVILPEIAGDDPSTELNIETISPDKPVTGLLVRDKYDLAVVNIDRKTTRATAFTDLTTNEEWHESRVIGPFVGASLPRQLRETNNGWSESILARPYQSLLSEATAAREITSILHEVMVDAVGVEGLSAFLDGGENQRKFEQRWALWKKLKSINNVALTDKDCEAWEVKSKAAGLAGLAPLMEKYANRIAAEVDIPMSRLYGKLASGLTTSADVNLEDYQAMIAGYQKSRIDCWLRVLDTLLCMSTYGRIPDGFVAEWIPLGEASAKEKAETLKIIAEAFEGLIRTGVLVPAHAVEFLASDSTIDISEEYLDYVRQRDGLIGGMPEEEPSEEEPPEEEPPEEEPPEEEPPEEEPPEDLCGKKEEKDEWL